MLRDGQITGLSKANMRAVTEDGADFGQVVNAYRKGSVRTAQLYGRQLKITTEGTTVRGLAGKRLSTNGVTRQPGARYRSAASVRIMPETIYQVAESRDDAVRLLKKYGWIT